MVRSKFLLVEGVLQNQDGVVHGKAEAAGEPLKCHSEGTQRTRICCSADPLMRPISVRAPGNRFWKSCYVEEGSYAARRLRPGPGSR